MPNHQHPQTKFPSFSQNPNPQITQSSKINQSIKQRRSKKPLTIPIERERERESTREDKNELEEEDKGNQREGFSKKNLIFSRTFRTAMPSA